MKDYKVIVKDLMVIREESFKAEQNLYVKALETTYVRDFEERKQMIKVTDEFKAISNKALILIEELVGNKVESELVEFQAKWLIDDIFHLRLNDDNCCLSVFEQIEFFCNGCRSNVEHIEKTVEGGQE